MQFRPGQIEGVEIIPLERHSDQRGWLAELYRSDEVNGNMAPAMGYISITKPGVSRGPHEHTDLQRPVLLRRSGKVRAAPVGQSIGVVDLFEPPDDCGG